MSEQNEKKQIAPIEDLSSDPNAIKVPPHESGFEPVEPRDPSEEEGQPYTGHRPAEQHALNVTPAVARGLTPVPPTEQ